MAVSSNSTSMSRRQALIPIAGLATGAGIGMAVISASDPIIAILNEHRAVTNTVVDDDSTEQVDAWVRKVFALDNAIVETKPTSREGAVELLKWVSSELDEFVGGPVHRAAIKNAIAFLSK